VNSFTPMNHSSFRNATTGSDRREGVHRPYERVVRVVTSESLFRGSHEIGIEHEGSMYRLKITRQGKLILNK
jgi:hemin uptake protein HemP